MFTKRYLLDLCERTVATYIETLLGLLLLGWADVTSASAALDLGTSAALAAAPAALAVVKSGLARLRGDREAASMLSVPLNDR